MYNNITGIIKKILENEILTNDQFIVDILFTVSGNGGSLKIEVESNDGISIEKCSFISKKLAELIEEKEIINEKYTLEVSSPGADRPLKIWRQYIKNIGRSLSVLTYDKEILKGVLLDADKEVIKLKTTNKGKNIERAIKMNEIMKSSVIISFK